MRRISILFLLGVLLPLAARAQSDTVSVRMVSADSLVQVMRLVSGNSLFIARAQDDPATYSLEAPRAQFLDQALLKLRTAGYTVTEWNGSLYIVHGHSLHTAMSPDWFKENRPQQAEAAVQEQNVAATYLNKVYEIGDEKHLKKGGKAVIHGYIRDKATSEPLVGITVFDEKSQTYAMTDNYGFWRMQVPTGDNHLNFSGYPMEDVRLEVKVFEDGGLDIEMSEKVIALKAATISAESVSLHRTARIGVEKIQADRIQKIPTAFGEADVIKAVLALPGVQSVGEASSGFNVRGGSVDQNLILYNDGTVFNPNHVFGILSSFNADLVSEAELYKSSIPAEYGGRISSVLDIRTREGNARKVSGSLGLGLLTSRFHLEGPLAKDKTTFMLGGRTTYSNWILKLLPKESHYHGGKTSFQDVNASITHKANARNTIQAFAYWSRDHFSFETNHAFGYYNLNGSVKWRHIMDASNNMELSMGYDSYQSSVEADKDYAYGAYRYRHQLAQEFLKLKFKSTLSQSHTLSYGLQTTMMNFHPGHRQPLGEESGIADRKLPMQLGLEPALYLSDNWTVNDRLSLDGGVRLGGFASLSSKAFYLMPELRLSAKYSILSNWTVKAGVNSFRQNIHMLTNSSTMSPMDVWIMASDKVRPQDGWQAGAGMYWTFGPVDISLEGYYKRSYNSVDYRSGTTLVMNEDLAEDLLTTTGRAYGAELMVRKSTGRLNGWISYTYARSLMKETQADDPFPINGGKWYNTPHDKPHTIKMVANYKFTHRYSISANLDYSTGRPTTVPVGVFYYGGVRRLAYSDRNAVRIPDYFRLDLAINVEPSHYLRRLTHLSFTLGVYNVTGRKNVYSVYYTADGTTDKPQGHMVSVFATQIPYINLNLKF